MAKEKKGMIVVFKMDKNMNTAEWRDRFNSGYQDVMTLKGLFFKSWWINQHKGEWGGFLIFDSNEDLEEYVTSDLWLKEIPQMYGNVKPEVTVVDVGPIICMKRVTEGGKTWLTE